MSSTESKVGLGITVQGWGRDNKGESGKLLTQIDVSIRSQEECNDKYNSTTRSLDQARIRAFIPDLLPNSMFCADSNLDRSIVGVCDGDSGGPAIFRYSEYFARLNFNLCTSFQAVQKWKGSLYFTRSC